VDIHEQNPNRQEAISSVLKVNLARCLDRNKRVQEASISALLSLLDQGKAQLVPHLNDIVQTLAKALQLYQLNNQRLLHDAIGHLAWAVGPELDKPQYIEAIVAPMFRQFGTVSDNDILALSLCECITNLSQVLGKSLAQALPGATMRALRSINDCGMASQMWERSPEEYERPPHEVMASCIDLLAGVVEGLQQNGLEIAKQFSFFSAVPISLRCCSSRVKQSGFYLMAVGTHHCMSLLAPLLPDLMPLCAAGLAPTVSPTVSMVACRAIGEVANQAPQDALNSFLNALVPALLAIAQRTDVKPWQMRGHDQLLRNTCMILNCLRQKTALGQQWAAAVSGQIAPDILQKMHSRYGLSQ